MPRHVCLRFRISGHLNQRTAHNPAEQKQKTNPEFALQLGREHTNSSKHIVLLRICPRTFACGSAFPATSNSFRIARVTTNNINSDQQKHKTT
eukprot:1139382-Alexandrium_andersonii.AAC.1